MITEAEVAEAQKAWADGIIEIGRVFTEKGDYKAEAERVIAETYGWKSGLDVLFKPTKASDEAIRLDQDSALSYFVGADAVPKKIAVSEDKGFAITPFTGIRWDNKKTITNGKSATAMGEYYFTDSGGGVTKAEYTFQYERAADGSLKIVVHHSSLPFSVPGASPGNMITEAEVAEAQKAWADGIIEIGRVFTEKGDYKAEAERVIAETYGWKSGLDVLFKPTKASDEAIRLDQDSALSYFVGADAVPKKIAVSEDKGFAITPFTGIRWDNKKTITNGKSATAMGEYYFTDSGGGVTKAEYTFQYERAADESLKIVVHHSSLPFSA